MNMTKYLIIALVCAANLKAAAATIPFRLGEILSSEISRKEVKIKNIGKFDYKFDFKRKAYAVVAIKLHKGRSLSKYDFTLNYDGVSYKCVALRSGNGAFDAKKWQIKKTSPNVVYSLIFVMDSEVFGSAKKKLEATLEYVIDKSGQGNIKIPFQFVNYDALTSPSRIPAKGVYPKVEIKKKKKPSGK